MIRSSTTTIATTSLKGTIVPVTLADGRTAQLFIPTKQANQSHGCTCATPRVSIKDNVTRDEVTRSPAVIEKEAEASDADKRWWEKKSDDHRWKRRVGTVIGAVAGGKKLAGIGAVAGGVGDLIYEAITRDKK